MDKNRLINPGFRALAAGMPVSSFTDSTAVETAQGWFFESIHGNGTAGGVAISQGVFTPDQTTMPGIEADDYLQLAFNGSWTPGTTTKVFLYQRLPLETLNRHLSSLSFWALGPGTHARLGYEIRRNYGTGGTPSPDDIIASGHKVLSSAWQQYVVPVTVPAMNDPANPGNARVLGTDGNGYLQITLYFQNGASVPPIGNLGSSAATFRLALAQWEIGDRVTAWDEPNPIQKGVMQSTVTLPGGQPLGTSTVVRRTASFTAASGQVYGGDTTSGSITATPVPAPTDGTWFGLMDIAKKWGTSTMVVGGGGDMFVDLNNPTPTAGPYNLDAVPYSGQGLIRFVWDSALSAWSVN